MKSLPKESKQNIHMQTILSPVAAQSSVLCTVCTSGCVCCLNDSKLCSCVNIWPRAWACLIVRNNKRCWFSGVWGLHTDARGRRCGVNGSEVCSAPSLGGAATGHWFPRHADCFGVGGQKKKTCSLRTSSLLNRTLLRLRRQSRKVWAAHVNI